MNIILYAIPGFFLLIAIELIAERIRGTDYYRTNDALTSLNLGVVSRMSGVLQAFIPFVLYVFIYQELRLFDMPDNWVVWVVAFILYDLSYYWAHRMGHEVNILWAAHVVHHSSEEYNLTTALRQTGTGFFSTLFYIPMALLGFDPLVVITVGALNLVYQFWVHTRHIPKLGVLEWVFITPSNHRVHHAQNPVYIDKNYGGVFIIWDRLFGTFQEELDDEPVVYGITGAVSSWDPIWANVQVYQNLLRDAIATKNWRHKFTIWFRRTGWRPPDVEERFPRPKPNLAAFRKFDIEIPTSIKVYGVLQYLTLAILVLPFLSSLDQLTSWHTLGMLGFFIFSAYALGVILENRSHAAAVEWIRVPLLMVGLLVVTVPIWIKVSVIVLGSCSLLLLLFGRRKMLSAPALP